MAEARKIIVKVGGAGPPPAQVVAKPPAKTPKTPAKTPAATSKPARKPGKTRKRKVAVFIDGSNFYFKLKTLVPTKMDLIHYRYRDLIKELLGADEDIMYFGYYVGVVRDDGKKRDTDKSHEMRRHQQQLFAELDKQQATVVRGYLLERGGKYFEKGVDVRLATDIVTMAYEKRYDVAYVVSSDTDLLPAIQKARERSRDVTYVGFEHQPSLALIRYANSSRLITRKEAEKFAAKPLQIRRFDEN